MHVVGSLRGRPQSQLPVWPKGSHCRVLFHGKMGVPLEEERVLPNMIGLSKTFLDIPEL